MSPDQVVGVVKDSELRGRGGAGFPCGLKWSFLPKDRKETLMCINGDESEPATFNNRLLIERDPHQFLEGILIGCFATRASVAYLYLRYEYIQGYRVLERAIAEAREAGHLGKNIYGSGFDLDVWLHRGAGAYICGEETGLIESLEGSAAGRGSSRRSRRSRGPSASRRSSTTSRPLLRAAHRRAGGRLVQVDRHAQELRAEAVLRLGHVNKQVCVELPLGSPAAS
jgi:NADH-quinone oxidoreductase subunit F